MPFSYNYSQCLYNAETIVWHTKLTDVSKELMKLNPKCMMVDKQNSEVWEENWSALNYFWLCYRMSPTPHHVTLFSLKGNPISTRLKAVLRCLYRARLTKLHKYTSKFDKKYSLLRAWAIVHLYCLHTYTKVLQLICYTYRTFCKFLLHTLYMLTFVPCSTFLTGIPAFFSLPSKPKLQPR